MSPPELDFEFPGPYWSIMITDKPISLRWRAVQPPKTPAPRTATSAVTAPPARGTACEAGACDAPDAARRTALPPMANVPALTPAVFMNVRRFIRPSPGVRDSARLRCHTVAVFRRQLHEPLVNHVELGVADLVLRMRGHLAHPFAHDPHELGIGTLQSRERGPIRT